MLNKKTHITKTAYQKNEYRKLLSTWNRLKNEQPNYILWIPEHLLSEKEKLLRKQIINKNLTGDTSLQRNYAKKIMNIGKLIHQIK